MSKENMEIRFCREEEEDDKPKNLPIVVNTVPQKNTEFQNSHLAASCTWISSESASWNIFS